MLRALCILVVALGATTAQAQRLRIVVGGPNFRPYPIAAPAFVTLGEMEGGAELAERLTRTLQQDIDIARSLALVPVNTYLAPDKEPWTQPNFAAWVNVGASGLVRGGVRADAGSLDVTLRFYDVVSQRELLTKSFTRTAERAHTAVHAFMDELIEMLTGERGVFSSRITYVRGKGKDNAIYVCDFDGSNEERVTELGALSLLPAWSADGQSILFTSYSRGNPDLFLLDLASRRVDAVSQRQGLNTGGAMSPDGKRIALTLSVDRNTEIYVMDVGGKDLRRLTDSWGEDVSPVWSPDGKRIAFVSSRAGDPHIYVMNADGSEQRRLTFQGRYNQEPDWSPRADGQIVFTARDELLKYDIFLVHPETSEITRLTQDEGNNESPSFSPDGHHVVFTSTRSGQKLLYVMDADGRNQRLIAQTRAYHETPDWGPRLGYDEP